MSAELIGALRVTLGMDSAAFEKGADRSIAKMDAVSRAGYNTGRALRSLISTAVAAGAAIGVMFSVQAIKKALDYAAAVSDVSKQVGLTTTELQAYRYAAGQTGATSDELDAALQRLSVTIGRAGSGAKTEAHTFATLGVAIKDAEGNIRPTGDVLLDLADKLAAIPDPARRSAAVVALFGEQGKNLIPLLESGSAGLKQFAAEAEAAGFIIAEGDIAQANETADKIEQLTTQLKVDFSNEVAQNADAILSLAEALASLVGWLTKAAGAYLAFFDRLGSGAGKFVNRIAKGGKPGDFGYEVKDGLMRLLGVKPGASGKAAAGAASGVPAPDLTDLFNRPSGRGGGRARRDRTDDFGYRLASLQDDIEDAFGKDFAPESAKRAEELREKLDDIGESARKAGVPMSQFAGVVATLKARISELETEGLAREAREFSKEVEKLASNVLALDQNAMQPINRRLADVDERFNTLRDTILKEIEANAELSLVNEDARRTMQELVNLLGQLSSARKEATASVKAQFQAEQNLADIQAAQARQGIESNIADLSRARGDQGPFTSSQLELQERERALAEERLSSLNQLASLQAQLADAEASNDQLEVARLSGIIELQQQYYDLVTETSAEQLVHATRLQAAYEDFTNGLTDALEDFVTKGEYSFERLGDLLLTFLNDLFLKPALEDISKSIGGALKGLFAGGFATGGTIPQGQWGIVGERGPEPVFAADGPLRILPNETLGGGQGATFNVNVSGAMSDRDARRTGNQIGAAAARSYAAARKAGIAG